MASLFQTRNHETSLAIRGWLLRLSAFAQVACRDLPLQTESAMSEESWHEARLIPTSGINGAEEQERRATSALLAVLAAVREFGQAVLKPLGAPAGTVTTFIEVPFEIDGRRLFPDGLIRVTRGSRSWTALVEVKTSTNHLAREQLENYLDVARDNGFDALLTISNEIPPVAGQHPTVIDKRKLRKVAIHHMSWSEILATAVLQKEFRGVADPDQAWILGELIRYLEHSRSGALEFDDMGDTWTQVRDAVAAGTLRMTDKGLPAVSANFDALLRYVSLQLGRRLGTEVVPVLSRREANEPAIRSQLISEALVNTGQMSGAIRVPGTVGALHTVVDLRAKTVTAYVDVEAPKQGRPTTRVNWLVRQLKDSPDHLRVECYASHSRGASTAELLEKVRMDPTILLPSDGREIRSFRVALTRPLGIKRGRGRGSFIDSVIATVDDFYETVLQQLRAWSAAPPRLRQPDESRVMDSEPIRPPSLSSTDISSQDGPETHRAASTQGAAITTDSAKPDETQDAEAHHAHG